jgi:hypothetical protein
MRPLLTLLAAATFLLPACGTEQTATTTTAPETAPAASPTPSQPTVAFSDDFSNAGSGWRRTLPDENPMIDYRDGQYIVSIDNGRSQYVAASGSPATEFDDVILEADATKLSGDDSAAIGLQCRDTNAGRYVADIDETGDARILLYTREQKVLAEKKVPGTWTEGANRLRFDCVGDKLTFYVNGTEILTATDSSLPIGRIGVRAGGAGSGKTEAAFDNLVVSTP